MSYDAPPVRVRRVRSSSVRVRRTRAKTPDKPFQLPRYIVDFDKPWGSLLQLYLMSSYLYYDNARSIISDHEYDRLCQVLLAGWRTGVHQHKHLVSRSNLLAGTGYSLTGKYPTIVRIAAWMLLENYQEL